MGECLIVQRFKGSGKEIMRHFWGNITELCQVTNCRVMQHK
jgi:hypothetical protein